MSRWPWGGSPSSKGATGSTPPEREIKVCDSDHKHKGEGHVDRILPRVLAVLPIESRPQTIVGAELPTACEVPGGKPELATGVFYRSVVIVFLLGGARSGKSALAEAWMARLPTPVTYLATYRTEGQAMDEAMAARIEAHRRRRPAAWTTLEAGADLAGRLLTMEGSVLVDSLGTWVAGHDHFAPDGPSLCSALLARRGDSVVVSDEVGLSVHPETDVGVRFRDALGALNAQVAAIADRSVLVVAGRALPLGSWEELWS